MPDENQDSHSAQVIELASAAARADERFEDEELEALRDALEDLRHEIQSRFAERRPRPQRDSEAPRSPDAGFDWMQLFDELRRRVGTLGMVERSASVDDFGMDHVAIERARALLDFLFDRYWRVELRGVDRLDASEPVLFVANRSGLLPYDGLMFSHGFARQRPLWARPRFLVADWLITLPFVQPTLARLGGVRACRENADRLLRTGSSVLAFPEGVKGAAKAFAERYELKRFGRGGVVRTSLEAGVPIVPVGIVGAEEAHPLLYKSRMAGKAVGLPFVPVTPTFPLFGPLGALPLPSKWVITLGEPLDLSEEPADAASDALRVTAITEDLRARIRALMAEGLDRRESIWG